MLQANIYRHLCNNCYVNRTIRRPHVATSMGMKNMIFEEVSNTVTSSTCVADVYSIILYFHSDKDFCSDEIMAVIVLQHERDGERFWKSLKSVSCQGETPSFDTLTYNNLIGVLQCTCFTTDTTVSVYNMDFISLRPHVHLFLPCLSPTYLSVHDSTNPCFAVRTSSTR